MSKVNVPDKKRNIFSFGDDDDDEKLIRSLKPLPEQVVERSAFMADDFHPDQFLSTRRHLGLETLKSELNSHLKFLKTELVELINRDYQDFINLSTNLKGVDKAIDDLRKPLIQMESQDVRARFQQVIDTLEQQLQHRAEVRKKKARLKLLLNIHESVTKVEDLLEINADVSTSSLTTQSGAEQADDSLGKQIERVAIEFNQMQHLVGRGKQLPFVIENEWRISRIKETLQHKLSKALTTALSRLPSDESKSSLLQCLRTYALIDQTNFAESLIREKFVRPFLTKTITRKAVEPPKANAAPTTDSPLTMMYQKILTFVSKDMRPILQVTQRTLKGTNYEILVNSLWVEVVERINQHCNSIFAAGQTDLFHKNYSASISFVTSIEELCSSRKSLLYFRNHHTYTEFMKRWQLPVYFQLRFREIVSDGEELLNDSNASISVEKLQARNDFVLPGSKAISEAIEKCWSDHVFLHGLSHRFWKLTLQLLRRYNLWATNMVGCLLATVLAGEKDKASMSSRLPTTVGTAQELGTAEEMIALKQLVILTKVQAETAILPKLPTNVHDLPLLRECMKNILDNLAESTIPEANRKITGMVNRRCMESLKHVRSITSQYRHTNKPAPVEFSNFIPNLFQPFRNFMELHNEWIHENRREIWGLMVAEAIVTRYMTIVTELLTNLKKTEDSLKKLKKGKKNAVKPVLGSGSSEVVMSDEDKIRLQIYLDVLQIGEQLALLGIDKSKFECYDKLRNFVQPFEKLRTK
ncbi:Conserved oligomeric Golgi complex subunit 2 [Apophysomyces ossiformis]|uniref:Conserved oligomeric Golgi complex subunit 2 n=1 Tax=Apophysomyces ossiformis TaxID=679940 RepID=A0A8H7BSX8_9FUNG|nr:Conserved oligomeric Golgi complex subunit 2 [Apophysomyces ossiformis]